MTDFFGILCSLSISLAVLAVVGHGIWLLTATVWRGLRGTPPQRHDGASELLATCRYLDRLIGEDRIPRATYDLLREQLESDLGLQQRELPPRYAPAAPSPSESTPVTEAASRRSPPAVVAELVDEPAAVPPQRTAVAEETRAHEKPVEDSPPPRRRMTEVLSSFMLEKNIRWGELLSGMLVVGSAVGLVLSLQEELKRTIPYFPALLFMLVTAAIHAAGRYTLSKWNLRSTSQGVLTIGLLLVPLNFLAASLITHGSQLRAVNDLWFLTALVIGAITFSAMTYSSCRKLFDEDWWMPAVPIMTCSLAQPWINRVAAVTDGIGWQLLAAVPLLGVLIGNAGIIHRVRARPDNAPRDIERVLMTLGLGLFSLATAVGLLVARAASPTGAVSHLSVLLPIVSAVFIIVGHTVQSRCGEKDSGLLGTIGTAVAVLGGFLGLVALGLAWPDPEFVILVSALNFVVLAAAGFRTNLPAHPVGAAVNLGICTTVTCHWMLGHYSDAGLATTPLTLLASSTTTVALAIAAATMIAVMVMIRHAAVAPRQHAYWIGSTFFLAVVSVAVAFAAGFANHWTGGTGDLYPATAVLFVYACSALAAGSWFGARSILRGAASLLFLALFHALVLNLPLREQLPWLTTGWLHAGLLALLIHAATCGLAAAIGLVVRHRAAADELSRAGLVSSGLAVPLLVWLHATQFGVLAAELTVVCIVWLVGTIARRKEQEFAVFQGLLFATAGASAAYGSLRWGVCESWQDARFTSLLLFVLAGVALGWNLVRFWTPEGDGYRRLIRGRSLSVDQSILALLVASLLGGALISIVPGALAELAPDRSIWSATTVRWLAEFGASSWIPLICLVCGTGVWLADRPSRMAPGLATVF